MAILMSTHNIGFYEDLTKIIFELSSNIIKYAPYFFCWLHILVSMMICPSWLGMDPGILERGFRFTIGSLFCKFYFSFHKIKYEKEIISTSRMTSGSATAVQCHCCSHHHGNISVQKLPRKHLRTKVTPDLHLTYSKSGGNLGLV